MFDKKSRDSKCMTMNIRYEQKLRYINDETCSEL